MRMTAGMQAPSYASSFRNEVGSAFRSRSSQNELRIERHGRSVTCRRPCSSSPSHSSNATHAVVLLKGQLEAHLNLHTSIL